MTTFLAARPSGLESYRLPGVQFGRQGLPAGVPRLVVAARLRSSHVDPSGEWLEVRWQWKLIQFNFRRAGRLRPAGRTAHA